MWYGTGFLYRRTLKLEFYIVFDGAPETAHTHIDETKYNMGTGKVT